MLRTGTSELYDLVLETKEIYQSNVDVSMGDRAYLVGKLGEILGIDTVGSENSRMVSILKALQVEVFNDTIRTTLYKKLNEQLA